MTTASLAVEERAAAKLRAKTEPFGECLLWTGYIDSGGYGRSSYAGRTVAAHRLAYTLYIGPIPAGVPLDHMCHTRACWGGPTCLHRRCVNPAHLQPTTSAENTLRGVRERRSRPYISSGSCHSGHPWVTSNIRLRKFGDRVTKVCLGCERDRKQRVRERRRTGDLPPVVHPGYHRPDMSSDTCRAGLHRWSDQTPLISPSGRECRPCRNERKRLARKGRTTA